MSQQYSNIVLRFEPALKCSDCDTLTHYGLIGEIEFSPQCPTHGYAYGVSTADTYSSVERFVLAEFDGIGKATVLTSVTPDEVPGYVAEDVNGVASTEIDSAWTVQYCDAEGKQTTLFVTWEVAYLSFYLYSFDD